MQLLREYCPAYGYIVSIVYAKYDPDLMVDDGTFVDPNIDYTIVRCILRTIKDGDMNSQQWLVPSEEMETDEALLTEYQHVSACVNFARQVEEAARDYDIAFVMGEGFKRVPKE